MMFITRSIGVCCNWVKGACSRGRSIDMAFSQLLLVDFANGIAWQHVHKLDLAGRFIVRQPLTTVGHENLRIDGLASNNEGFDLFAHTLRGHANNGSLDNRQMRSQHFLNITWIDIEPAANDEIFLAFNNK